MWRVEKSGSGGGQQWVGGGELESDFTYSFSFLIGMNPSPQRTLGRLQGGPPHPLVTDKPVPLSYLDHLHPWERWLPLGAHDSEVQSFPEDSLSQCLVAWCRQMNIVFGDKRPQRRQLFGDGAFGSESSKCVQDSHVADPVLEESAFEIIADAPPTFSHRAPPCGCWCRAQGQSSSCRIDNGGWEGWKFCSWTLASFCKDVLWERVLAQHGRVAAQHGRVASSTWSCWALQNMNCYKKFSTFVDHFCPPGSGSGSRIRIRIQSTDPIESGFNPDPQPWLPYLPLLSEMKRYLLYWPRGCRGLSLQLQSSSLLSKLCSLLLDHLMQQDGEHIQSNLVVTDTVLWLAQYLMNPYPDSKHDICFLVPDPVGIYQPNWIRLLYFSEYKEQRPLCRVLKKNKFKSLCSLCIPECSVQEIQTRLDLNHCFELLPFSEEKNVHFLGNSTVLYGNNKDLSRQSKKYKIRIGKYKNKMMDLRNWQDVNYSRGPPPQKKNLYVWRALSLPTEGTETVEKFQQWRS